MSPGPLLSVSSLRRTVDGRVLWRDISFNVDKGDVIFVRGPSGSGKTLLLRALAALDPLEVGPPAEEQQGHATAACLQQHSALCAASTVWVLALVWRCPSLRLVPAPELAAAVYTQPYLIMQHAARGRGAAICTVQACPCSPPPHPCACHNNPSPPQPPALAP